MHIIESQVRGYGKVYRGRGGWFNYEHEAYVYDSASVAQGAIDRLKGNKWVDSRAQEAWDNAKIKEIK